MTVYLMTGNSGSSSSIFDDGTNYVFKVGSTHLFKVRKSDNQLLLDAGSTDDAF